METVNGHQGPFVAVDVHYLPAGGARAAAVGAGDAAFAELTAEWTVLGAHAHAEFGVPVIGVAKTRFRTASHAVEVRRGHSGRPLLVTAAGMPAAEAASLVSRMAGPFRIPAALRRADALARRGAP